MTASLLTSVRLPVEWEALGFPAQPRIGGVDLSNGAPAWGWDGPPPELAVPEIGASTGTETERWGLDHVVLLVPDLDSAASALYRVGHEPRLKLEVKGRPTAFFRVGTVLEVIETKVPSATLYGIALTSDTPLEGIADAWRQAGLDAGQPHDAVQPGRRIFSVNGLAAGLAVMSPDTAA